MFCCEVSVLRSDVLKLRGHRVDNLDIASDVLFAPDFAVVVEAGRDYVSWCVFAIHSESGEPRADILLFVGNLTNIELVIPWWETLEDALKSEGQRLPIDNTS